MAQRYCQELRTRSPSFITKKKFPFFPMSQKIAKVWGKYEPGTVDKDQIYMRKHIGVI